MSRREVAQPRAHAPRHPDRDVTKRSLEAVVIELTVGLDQAIGQVSVIGVRGFAPSSRRMDGRARNVEGQQDATRASPYDTAALDEVHDGGEDVVGGVDEGAVDTELIAVE